MRDFTLGQTGIFAVDQDRLDTVTRVIGNMTASLQNQDDVRAKLDLIGECLEALAQQQSLLGDLLHSVIAVSASNLMAAKPESRDSA